MRRDQTKPVPNLHVRILRVAEPIVTEYDIFLRRYSSQTSSEIIYFLAQLDSND